MATMYPADDPLLRRGFEPIRIECDCADLCVDGTIPDDLRGTLYRIGPNPQFAPRGRYNPPQGDGMIHAFVIYAGRVAYKNRWVRTHQWTLERAGTVLTSNPRTPCAACSLTSSTWTTPRCAANRLARSRPTNSSRRASRR